MAYQIELKQLPAQAVMSSRSTTPVAKITDTIGELLTGVWAHLQKHGARPAGPPFTRYHRIEGDRVELEGGLPVTSPVPSEGRIQPGELPGGEVISTDHFGRYEDLPRAGQALDAWLAEHGRTAAGPNWEIYWTDPGAEKDPAKWRTEVIKPLAPR